jgi:tetratricopeptide (TPR) repeat protein
MKTRIWIVAVLALMWVTANAQDVPEEARMYYVQAVTLMKHAKDAGQMTEPIELLRRAALLAPAWADVHHDLANALELTGQYDDAIAEYNRYLKMNPSDPKSREIRDHIYELQVEKKLAQQRQQAEREAFRKREEENNNKQKRFALAQSFRGLWKFYYCTNNPDLSIGCNQREFEGKNWRVTPVTFIKPINVTDDGAIRAGHMQEGKTFFECSNIDGTYYGVPLLDGSGIRWEFRDAKGITPLREVWGEYGTDWFIVSCDRPVQRWLFDPNKKYRYYSFKRQ